MSKEKIGRIASAEWADQRPEVIGIFHGAYDPDGRKYDGDFPKPWTVIAPAEAHRFTTHAEALAWAFEKAEAGK